MFTPSASHRSDFGVGTPPILMATALLGLGLVVAAEVGSGGAIRPRLHAVALLLYGLAAIGWILELLRSGWGAWCAVLGSMGIILISRGILHFDYLLVLMVIPVTVMFAAEGLGAAFIASATATLLLALFGNPAANRETARAVAAALTVIWGVNIAHAGFWGRVVQLDRWLDEYLHRARVLVNESRDRKADLAQALDDLTHLNRQMTLMTQRQVLLRQAAEEAERSKAAYVARVSHEFRTPLNIIIGMVDLMVSSSPAQGEPWPDGLAEHLGIVHRNCQHLASMVDDVLDLSRLEAERMSLDRTWVDVRQLIDTSLQVVEPLIREKGLNLSVDYGADSPSIYCDRIRIRQVLLNLLSNAARATEAGGIKLTVEQRAEALLLSVSDTGPGIPPDVAQAIFEPFVQGAQRSSGKQKGSGLGLSISKQFVDMHGGRMWVDTQPGRGTTFFVELPRGPMKAHIARAGHQIQEEWAWRERRSRPRLPRSQFHPQVLLCDATGELKGSLPRLRDDLEFVICSNASTETWDMEAGSASVVVVNDISAEAVMATMEKAAATDPDVAVIGWVCPPRLERAREMGAIGHLVKPVSRQAVESVLQALPYPPSTVLVVEDDADTQELMRMMLHSIDQEMRVTVSADSRQAVSQMRAAPPDLVLLDIVLPDIDGWQLLALIRDDKELRRIPTAVISGQDPLEEKVASRWLMAMPPKPMDLPRLLDHSISLWSALTDVGSGLQTRH